MKVEPIFDEPNDAGLSESDLDNPALGADVDAYYADLDQTLNSSNSSNSYLDSLSESTGSYEINEKRVIERRNEPFDRPE